jgi:hypothetical protein
MFNSIKPETMSEHVEYVFKITKLAIQAIEECENKKVID